MSDSSHHIISALQKTTEAQREAYKSYEDLANARRHRIEELRLNEINRIRAQADQDIRFTNQLFKSLQMHINEVSDDVYSFYRLFHFEDLPKKDSTPEGST